VVIDSSSISPDAPRDHASKLAARGISHLDAPVSGCVVGAAAGTLAIMAGGDAALIDELADVFAPLGRITHVGPSGCGQLAKLGNQQIVAITIGAVAEGMLLVEAGGGSREAFRRAIRGGFAEAAFWTFTVNEWLIAIMAPLVLRSCSERTSTILSRRREVSP
jgi:2-hydroxy-3-oxopropionate reductase